MSYFSTKPSPYALFGRQGAVKTEQAARSVRRQIISSGPERAASSISATQIAASNLTRRYAKSLSLLNLISDEVKK